MAAPFDQNKAEQFADTLRDILNDGALALMISIGRRTGLFETLATLPPSTSSQIAQAAGLSERYVREWLGAMVTGRIVDYDPTARTYVFPPEHAASLTDGTPQKNLAVMMQYIPLLGTVEDGIVRSFRNRGGLPYAAYPRLQQVMAEESQQTVTTLLVKSILPLMPGIVEALHDGIEVLDVGCGRGYALNLLAQTFPNSRFTGYDFSPASIAVGQAEAQERELSNVDLIVKDILAMTEIDHYRLITAFDVIHDQAKPREVLKRVALALQPQGTFLMQDIAASSDVHSNRDHPLGPLLYTMSCMHCLSVSLALNGEGLGAMWGEETACQLLREAGFSQVEVHHLAQDIQNAYFVARKGG